MAPLWPAQRAFGEAGVPAGVTVLVSRRPLVARPGSGVKALGAWEDAEDHEVDGVGLDRTTTANMQADAPGESRTQSGTLFGPADADIRQGDRVTFPNGVRVEVEGIPDRSTNLFTGWRPPMSVTVKVTHG